MLGGEYGLNTRQDQQLYDEVCLLSSLDDRRESQVWALFIPGRIRITRSLLLNAGLRHDSYETFGGTTNPRCHPHLDRRSGDDAQGTPRKRVQGAQPLCSSTAPGRRPDPEAAWGLRPETIASYELVAERQISRALRGSLSVYHFEAERLIRLTTDPADNLLVFGNLSQVRQGVEAEAEATVGPVLARASYALQHVRDVVIDGAPVNSPTHVGRIGDPFRFSGRARVSTEVRFLSARRTVADDVVPAYGIVNVTLLGEPFRNGFEFSGSVYNLLGHSYADPGGDERSRIVSSRMDESSRSARGISSDLPHALPVGSSRSCRSACFRSCRRPRGRPARAAGRLVVSRMRRPIAPRCRASSTRSAPRTRRWRSASSRLWRLGTGTRLMGASFTARPDPHARPQPSSGR